MKLAHLFIPHALTHQKANLLSWQFLAVYIFIFIFLQFGLDSLSKLNPDILGTSSNITVSKIIEETNKERQKLGLSPLRENPQLNQAAYKKALNMFEENYWAHFSPSGKDPWGFILGSGYKFSYAGENLAKNFTNSQDVIIAWMNSPSHKENLLNSNYQEIGIAVEDGNIGGQNTTLIVQMFAKPYQTLAQTPKVESNTPPVAQITPKIQVEGRSVEVNQAGPDQESEVIPNQPTSESLAFQAPSLENGNQTVSGLGLVRVDPLTISKSFGIFIITFISLLLIIDLVVLRRRGVFRFSSHHVAHLSFLAVAGTALTLSEAGSITSQAVSTFLR